MMVALCKFLVGLTFGFVITVAIGKPIMERRRKRENEIEDRLLIAMAEDQPE